MNPSTSLAFRQRQRPVQDNAQPKEAKPSDAAPSPRSRIRREDAYSPYLDALRVLAFVVLAACFLSYFLSGGESWVWGMKDRPRLLQMGWWQSLMRGPLVLSLDELAAFNGTDMSKPIYLAINGTIYDVTAGRPTYGPGGSYHNFAGCDASRAYVTGCFGTDRTGDMRGVEEMYIPQDDFETDRQFDPEELRRMRIQERRDAKERVHKALLHWVEFFAKSKKYHFVGYVRRPPGWPKGEKRQVLCEQAQSQRAKRKIPGSKQS